MSKQFHFTLVCFIAMAILSKTVIASSSDSIKLSAQLQEIKDDVASSAENGDLKILFEKTYQASALHYKTKIKIEQGKSYEIFAVMDKSIGEVTTKLFDSNGKATDFDGGQFDDDGIKYSGHNIASAKQNQELTLQVVTDKLANSTPIYLAVLESLEPVPDKEQSDIADFNDNYYKTTITNLAYYSAYSPTDFSIIRASELPIIFEMNVHEGNDYRVIATFSTNSAVPRVIVADPDRGNGSSEDGESIASFEIRTTHKGVKKYYVKIEKASGNLTPNDKVYLYTGYRTSSNTADGAKAAGNQVENHFSQQ